MYVAAFELPPRTATIDVIQGSKMLFVSSSDQRIEAVVSPKGPAGVRTVLLLTGLVMLGGLYYISDLYGHTWTKAFSLKLPVPVASRLRRT